MALFPFQMGALKAARSQRRFGLIEGCSGLTLAKCDAVLRGGGVFDDARFSFAGLA
jgi:hypothetical protein